MGMGYLEIQRQNPYKKEYWTRRFILKDIKIQVQRVHGEILNIGKVIIFQRKH
jgi:hypothetical protein